MAREVKLTGLGGRKLLLGNKGLSIRVDNAAPNGQLRVGKGGVFWTDKVQGARTVKKGWEEFVQFMKSP